MDGKYNAAKRAASACAGRTPKALDSRQVTASEEEEEVSNSRSGRPNALHSLEVEARQATTFGHSRMKHPNQEPVKGHSADPVSDVTSSGIEVAETDVTPGSIVNRVTSEGGRSDQIRFRAFPIHKNHSNSDESSNLERKLVQYHHHQRLCPVHSSPLHRQLIRINGELSDHRDHHSFSSNRKFEFTEPPEEDAARRRRKQFSDANVHPPLPGADREAAETTESPPKRGEEHHGQSQKIAQQYLPPPPISSAVAAAASNSSTGNAGHRLATARTELYSVAEGCHSGGGGDGREGGGGGGGGGRRFSECRIADGDSGYSSDGGIAYSSQRIVMKQGAAGRRGLRPLRECIEHHHHPAQNPPNGYDETQLDLMANDRTRRLFRSQSNVTSLIKNGTNFENEVIRCNGNRCNNKHGCIGDPRCNIGQQTDTEDDAREDPSSRTRIQSSCRSSVEADSTGRVTTIIPRSERERLTESDSQGQRMMTSNETTGGGGKRPERAGNPGSGDHLGQEKREREVAGAVTADPGRRNFPPPFKGGRSEFDADERKIPAAVTFCDVERPRSQRQRHSLTSNDVVSSDVDADEIIGSTHDDVTVRFSGRHQCDDVKNRPVTMTRSLNECRSVTGTTGPASTSSGASSGEHEDSLKLLRPKMAAQLLLTHGSYDDPVVTVNRSSEDSAHKTFRSRFQGFGGLSETGSAVARIDYCNSLPRRARRSESVGSGVGNVVRRERGRSSDGRHSFGASTGATAHLSRAVDSLPATPKQRSLSRDDSDMHASLLSLISNASSVYSTGEENHAQEIRKLKDELELAYAKINTLTMQLNANVHVVTAFEQSLSNMTHRLQKLTNSSEQKDQELNNLKTTLYQLQQQSNSVRTEIMQKTSLSLSSSNSSYSFSTSTSLPRFNPGLTGFCALSVNHHHHQQQQHDKSSSSNLDCIAPSKSSSCHAPDTHEPLSSSSSSSSFERKQKKKGWLSTSFTKAFSRKKSKDTCDVDEVDLLSGVVEAATSVPNSPCLGAQNLRNVPNTPLVMSRQSFESPSVVATETRRSLGEMMGDGGGGIGRGDSQEIILHLKQQLHEKEMKLTDIRLEALSSAHQLEQLRDAMNQMKVDMDALKAENEKMQSIIAQKGLAMDSMFPSGTSPSSTVSSSSPSASSLLKKSLILGEPTHFDSLSIDAMSKDAGPRYTVAVQLGPWTEDDSNQLATTSSDCHMNLNPPLRVIIGTVGLTSTTKWETLDSTVRRIFKEHVNRLDPGGGLGLGGESVLCYHVGEITRTKGSKMPELLPCGYLVGLNTTIILSLKGVHERCLDALAFETLIPKTVVQRYVSLLTEHKRVILCGPGGTGKTYLAGKLAEYLVIQSGRELDSGAISTFTIDSKCDQEFKQHLSKMAEKCQRCRSTDQTVQQNSSIDDMPVVIIVDNLEHITSLEDVFHSFLNFNCKNCPFIIGTMTQMTSSAVGANLQMHYNYRWILLTLETEPVCHFLSRHLQRRLIEHEISSNTKSCLLGKVVEWLSAVWVQLNKFLKNRFASSESILGTRLFASCPMDLRVSEEWFTDLWNYSIIPYLLEATRNSPEQHKTDKDGSILDPTNWVIESYPWPNVEKREFRSLMHLKMSSNCDQNVQDVTSHVSDSTLMTDICTEGQIGTPAKVIGDPLMTILEKLNKTTSKDESTESREIPHR